MTARTLGIVTLALIALTLWWKHVPDATGRFEAMSIDTEAGRIDLDGVTYTAEFGDAVLVAGDLRFTQTVAHDSAPIITHELVVTTGEYSDPEFTKIEPWGAGTVRVEAPRAPTGTLTMIHAIPANREAVVALDALAEGAIVQVTGRTVVGSRIGNSNGGWIRLTHSGHEMLLVESVRVN